MNRKSRLATSWERIGPRLDELIQSEIRGVELAALRGLSRTLACWCVRLTHSPLANASRAALLAWSATELAPAHRELARVVFSLWDPPGAFGAPLREMSELAMSRVLAAGDPLPGPLDIVNRVHEFLLWREAPTERKRRGAYYTPQCVARTVMELAQQRAISLTPDGLGIWSPFSKVMDLAAGTGTFFAAGLELKQCQTHATNGWTGVEIDAETHAIGQFCMACQRIELGMSLERGDAPSLICADALALPLNSSAETGVQRAVPMIVGNPPYSVLGDRDAAWVDELLRGKDPFEDLPRMSYHRQERQSAKHRKHSLADDYVRFLRLAHWEVEKAGCGVVALILNHNILENRSFCELRKALSDHFDDMLFLDLHGNAKRRELTPEGGRDESVFNIEQGTMIAVLAKWPDRRAKIARRGHVFGLREEKLAKIASRQWETDLVDVAPSAPQFYFHCQRRAKSRVEKAYAAAPSLTEIFPVHSTAIVTARDALVVDADLMRLQARVREFADLRISESAIREKYFSGGGDTRSWKLDRARKALSDDGMVNIDFCGFWYRPWDWRWLAYSKRLLDWRREALSLLLLSGKNLALIARRQSPPGAACNYVWTTNSVVLDGILRSDNRGTESVFPLYGNALAANDSSFNFSQRFRDSVIERRGAAPQNAFFTLVAILHSPTYQHAFREDLCRDFPRLLWPDDLDVASKLAQIGRNLVAAQTLSAREAPTTTCIEVRGTDLQIRSGHPKFRSEAIWLNSTTRIEGVPEELWNFQAGAHRPILRWLKQRRHRALSEVDIAHVRQMLEAARAVNSSSLSLLPLFPSSDEFDSWSPAF